MQRRQEVEAQKQAEKEQRAQKLRELEERRVREREERIRDMEKCVAACGRGERGNAAAVAWLCLTAPLCTTRIEEGNPLCGIYYYKAISKRLDEMGAAATAQPRSPAPQESHAGPESVPASPSGIDLLREEEEAVEEQERLQPESDKGYWADGAGKGDLDFGCLEEDVPPVEDGGEALVAGNGGTDGRSAMEEEEEEGE